MVESPFSAAPAARLGYDATGRPMLACLHASHSRLECGSYNPPGVVNLVVANPHGSVLGLKSGRPS